MKISWYKILNFLSEGKPSVEKLKCVSFQTLSRCPVFFIFSPHFHFERWKKKCIPPFRIRYLLPAARRWRNFKGAPLRALLRAQSVHRWFTGGYFQPSGVRQFASRWKRLPTKRGRDSEGEHEKARMRERMRMNERMNLPCRTRFFYVFSHFFSMRVTSPFMRIRVYTVSSMHRGRKQLGDNLRAHIEKNVIRQNDRNFELSLHTGWF